MDDNILPDFDFTDEEITVEAPPSEDNFNSKESSTPDNSNDTLDNDVSTDVDNDDDFNQSDSYSAPEGEATGLYQFYRDKGFISADYEDFDGSYDSLAEILEEENNQKTQMTQESIIKAIVESPNPVTSKILEYVVTKGNNLQPEDLKRLIDQAEVINTELTEDSFDNEDVAEQYLMQHLSEQGDDEETIEDILELYRDKGTLKRKALVAFKKDNEGKLKSLNNEIETAKYEQEQERENLERFQDNFIQAIESTNWKNTRKQTIYNELAQGGFKDKIENIYNHPRGLVQLLDFMSYFNPENGVFELDNYKKASFSDGVKETKQNLMNYFRGNGNLSGSDRGFNTRIKSLNDIEFAD